MASVELIYINFKGGIVSPGYLKTILQIASAHQVSHVSFGLLQQLMLDVPVKHYNSFTKACEENSIVYYKKKAAIPNIVTSYPAAGIFTLDSWLREGVYKDILNLFDYAPKLKINVCDSTQSFVPFFTGHLNWISSPTMHFWYLYLRLPKTQNVVCWPQLVYTNDIAALSKHLEQCIIATPKTTVNALYKKCIQTINYIGKPVEKEIDLPRFHLPYYEGFNKYDNHYWLGIYRRDELFPVQFLIDVCTICQQNKIGEMYTTPWKSIIIKGINTAHRKFWDYVLGSYRINVRHAANELNWQMEDYDEEGLMIKRNIIRYFDKEDVRTYGLSFAVQTSATSNLFGSVIIRKQQSASTNRLKSFDRFHILHTTDFNPNASNLVSYRQDVEKEHLGTYLVSLCKMFYEKEIAAISFSPETAPPPANALAEQTESKTLYQCKNCFTVYDEELGDEALSITSGTLFINLSPDFCCPLCESPKDAFVQIQERSLQLHTV